MVNHIGDLMVSVLALSVVHHGFDDIGDGWWEAKNSLGHQGLIPEAYVQV
jgi:hypothetical protein